MIVKLVYKDNRDRDFINLLDFKVPIFIEYINVNTNKGKKEGWKLMNYYGTTMFPFIELEISEDNKVPFYSENGYSINQLHKYLTNESKN